MKSSAASSRSSRNNDMYLADYHIHSTCSPDGKLSMAEIAAVLELLLQDRPLEQAYDLFCRELELRLAALDGPDSQECPPVLAAAIRAVACKIAVEQGLAAQSAPAETQ